MELTKEVVASCVEVIREQPDRKAVIIPEESIASGFWGRCKRLERTFYIGVDWMEAARLFERGAFENLGGYDEEITGTEDHDLPMRLKSIFGKASISRVDALVYHNEQDLSLIGTCRKKYYYGETLDRYVSRQSCTVDFRKRRSIIRRFGLFLRDPASLFAEPLVGLGMLYMRLCEFVAMVVGLLASRMLGRK